MSKLDTLRATDANHAARRSEILRKFGTVEAFIKPTVREFLLAKAAGRFVTEGTTLQAADPQVAAAIKSAVPFPATVAAALAELNGWDELKRDRALFFDRGEYHFDLAVEMRVELLRNMVMTESVSIARRTNAQKAADVQSMLTNRPWLADREIARRVGVSPQTVCNWRKRLSKASARRAA